jgi:acyl carrier protein
VGDQAGSDDALIEQQILEIIATEGNIDRARLTPNATFDSLELQSIDVVMILMALEEKFAVYVPVDGEIADAKDLRGFVENIASRILESRKQSAA